MTCMSLLKARFAIHKTTIAGAIPTGLVADAAPAIIDNTHIDQFRDIPVRKILKKNRSVDSA